MLSIILQCVTVYCSVCEYSSAYFTWGTWHDPANLFEACCGQMPTVTMARQDFIKCCIHPHAFDCGILVWSLCMLCMARATPFRVCSSLLQCYFQEVFFHESEVIWKTSPYVLLYLGKASKICELSFTFPYPFLFSRSHTAQQRPTRWSCRPLLYFCYFPLPSLRKKYF